MNIGVVDIGSYTLALPSVCVLTKTSAILKGYFVDQDGQPLLLSTGAYSVSGSALTANTLVGLLSALGLSAFPANAAGFRGTLTGTLMMAGGGTNGLTAGIPLVWKAEVEANLTRFTEDYSVSGLVLIGRA